MEENNETNQKSRDLLDTLLENAKNEDFYHDDQSGQIVGNRLLPVTFNDFDSLK